jgi:hypothetical protein
LAVVRLHGALNLLLDASMLNEAPFGNGGKSMKVCAAFATSCCTKTKRQNSYLNQSEKAIDPAMPVRSSGSRRRLVSIGQSTFTVPPSQPPGWSMNRYL